MKLAPGVVIERSGIYITRRIGRSNCLSRGTEDNAEVADPEIDIEYLVHDTGVFAPQWPDDWYEMGQDYAEHNPPDEVLAGPLDLREVVAWWSDKHGGAWHSWATSTPLPTGEKCCEDRRC